MDKKWLLGILFCISLCTGCKEKEDIGQDDLKVESVIVISEETILPEEEAEGTDETESFMLDGNEEILGKYKELVEKENVKRMAFIYLDEDRIPELLFLKNGEYRLYSFDGSEVGEIEMPSADIKMNAYGPAHEFEEAEKQIFYWFEYVPYQGLLRVHTGDEGGRNDFYLRYADSTLISELKSMSNDYTWYTYDAGNEIDNDKFKERICELGYDKLIPCGYLYEDIRVAYENIGRTTDARERLNEFVIGEIDAVEYVEEVEDIPEDSYIVRSFDEIYKDITCEEDWWGKEEYTDFDNDGQDELILHGYAGSRMFFDVIGETVYVLLRTGGTTDNVSVAKMYGDNVVVRTDLLHGGRELYRIMKYDMCGCLIDYFSIAASYEGENYTQDDDFKYNDKAISMEEFETIVNAIER